MITLNVSTNSFSIKDKCFVADISDLNSSFPGIINLKSERTGEISEWIKAVTDDDYIVYVPTGKTTSKFPSLKNWSIKIFND
jgi:hypothetical protein